MHFRIDVMATIQHFQFKTAYYINKEITYWQFHLGLKSLTIVGLWCSVSPAVDIRILHIRPK